MGIHTLFRAFSDGKECVLALLSRSGSVTLPENLKPEAVYDIDGRPLPLPAGRTLAVPNKIAYLTLPESRLRKFLQTDTRAMELCEVARRHQPRRRPVRPAVFQNRIDINESQCFRQQHSPLHRECIPRCACATAVQDCQ